MSEFFEEFFNFGPIFEVGPNGSSDFEKILDGFWLTLQLSLVAGVLSLVWGLILAVMRQTPGRLGVLVRLPTIGYINVFRGVPQLLVILIVFASMGQLAFDGVIPDWLGYPEWFGKQDVFWYGAIAITLTYGAYMAEVYRAGIEAVPSGQMEAARSLGMSHGEAMRHVIVPQAVRKVIPPLLNDFIALMKDTSLVSFIGLLEVVQVTRDIQTETLNTSPLMIGALLFLAVTIPLAMALDRLIERQQRREQRAAV